MSENSGVYITMCPYDPGKQCAHIKNFSSYWPAQASCPVHKQCEPIVFSFLIAKMDNAYLDRLSETYNKLEKPFPAHQPRLTDGLDWNRQNNERWFRLVRIDLQCFKENPLIGMNGFTPIPIKGASIDSIEMEPMPEKADGLDCKFSDYSYGNEYKRTPVVYLRLMKSQKVLPGIEIEQSESLPFLQDPNIACFAFCAEKEFTVSLEYKTFADQEQRHRLFVLQY